MRLVSWIGVSHEWSFVRRVRGFSRVVVASHWVAHCVPWVRDCAAGAPCVVSIGVATGCSYFVRVCFVCTGWGCVVRRVTAVGSSGVGGFGVASIVCPACGVPAGSWCVRHGRIQAGPSLACVARVRAVRSAVACPVSEVAGPVHLFVPGSGVVVSWSVMGDTRQTVEVCADCGEHSEGVRS